MITNSLKKTTRKRPAKPISTHFRSQNLRIKFTATISPDFGSLFVTNCASSRSKKMTKLKNFYAQNLQKKSKIIY